ncbi:alkaline phosphatase family protein [Annulohypoxylon maeteangense]|uniref:alkaline phosphatase family protein n=1 Tax=Annulohypoxylon maeteangense TaxID=1927788 RepID=UPI0020075201|nr:alkaline phosphatase family protein [Annulohypoxylon maeteangense]KAI0884408.1 alkaline phosphatase family protein [Annulohypoxylon maeteangense]
MGGHKTTATITSAGIRIASVIFLRWVALPPIISAIYALFAIYVPSFILGYLNESKYELLDEVDVVLKEDILNKDEIANGTTDEAVVVEEVDVEETDTLRQKPLNPIGTLLKGTPNPNSFILTALTFLINAACIAMVTDMVYTPRWSHPSHDLSFARVGYVSDTEAKLLIREPDQSKMPITVQVHIKDAKPPFDNPLWQTAGDVKLTTNETDYTALVTIPLTHSKQRVYEWTTSNNHSGEFTSAPKPGTMPELFDGKFTFLSTSCIVPRLPYNPLDHPLAFPGMKHLAKVLPDLGAQFMLFLGDFIYIEVPKRFGESVENYRQKYRQVYASPDWPAVGQNLSWIHVLDDHEISNDWDSNSTGVYQTAVDPWRHYQTVANPPVAKKSGTRSLVSREEATYFSFTQGPASFFMLDTRSYRSKNSEPFDSPNKTMLGETQLGDFLDWLRHPEPKGVKWKVVASSVPFTKNWRVNTRDTWGGFLSERRKILEAMWDASILGVGVVVLSGDRHEFGVTAFPPPKNGTWPESATVHEFSASPLNQFYSPIGTYSQTDDEDVELKYINKGNSKFGVITMEKFAEGEQSSLKYTVYIDGVDKWNTVILSPEPLAQPVKSSGSFWDRLRGL